MPSQAAYSAGDSSSGRSQNFVVRVMSICSGIAASSGAHHCAYGEQRLLFVDALSARLIRAVSPLVSGRRLRGFGDLAATLELSAGTTKTDAWDCSRLNVPLVLVGSARFEAELAGIVSDFVVEIQPVLKPDFSVIYCLVCQ